MKRSKVVRCVAALVLALAPTLPSVARADAVTDWNAIMQATVAVAPTNPHYQSRWGAIVQLAVFEAVNAIEGDYEPYLGVIDAPEWASPDAAAIAAAHLTLATLRPNSAPTLDALRAASLAALTDGPDEIEAGIIVGENAALAMLMLRANDGWDAVVSYTPGTDPGDWQPPTPTTPASLPHWGQVTPFGLISGSQFRLPPPPALHTGLYAHDYNEVMILGRVNSSARPQDRTDVARFFAMTSPVAAWNPAARQASAAQDLTLSENARLFALLGMALADGSIAAYETKYYYGFWRPQTAIQQGDLDGNQHTVGDPTWVPLLATPAFPSYASAHATLSAAARAVLERELGKDGHTISLTHQGLGVTLNYTAWEEITDDIDDARIYGGIHFRFEQERGAHQGRQVGRYMLRNYLRSVDEL